MARRGMLRRPGTGPVRGFIDRIVDGVAVILLEGGGRAYVPASELPPGLAAGTMVEVTVDAVQGGRDPQSAEEVASLIERLRGGEHRHG